MKTVLVPVDFSEHDAKVLQYATELSKKEAVQLILIHVFDKSKGSRHKKNKLFSAPAEVMMMALNEKLLQIRKMLPIAQIQDVITVLYNGPVAESILKVANDHHADLILMRTSGTKVIKGCNTGRNTAALLRTSTIPVLMIPPDYQWSKLEKVLIAINSENENPEILGPAFNLSRIFGAALNIFIFTKEQEGGSPLMADTDVIYKIRENLKLKYPNAAIGITHISGKDFTTSIKEYIAQKKYDLLAMITHHKSWIQNLAGKSMTLEMAYTSAIPMLSINPA